MCARCWPASRAAGERDEGLDAVRVEPVPLLLVEVLARGTRSRDQVTKRRVYEQAWTAQAPHEVTVVPAALLR